jgi:hypothetical protein
MLSLNKSIDAILKIVIGVSLVIIVCITMLLATYIGLQQLTYKTEQGQLLTRVGSQLEILSDCDESYKQSYNQKLNEVCTQNKKSSTCSLEDLPNVSLRMLSSALETQLQQCIHKKQDSY